MHVLVFNATIRRLFSTCNELNDFYYYYYYYYYYFVASCHMPYLPGTSLLEPTAIPTAKASSFRLHYPPYYV